MKKTKRVVIIIAALIAVAAVSIFLIVRAARKEKYSQINLAMQTLQAKYDVDLVFYGDAVPPSCCDFKYRRINRITEEALDGSETGNCYHMVVVTDLFDSCDITKEELLLLKRYCEEKKYAFCYAGDMRELMKECGFWNEYGEDEYGFSYSGYRVTQEDLELKYFENPYVVFNFFEEDREGKDIEVWLNFLFAVEGQMDFDLTDGKGLAQ